MAGELPAAFAALLLLLVLPRNTNGATSRQRAGPWLNSHHHHLPAISSWQSQNSQTLIKPECAHQRRLMTELEQFSVEFSHTSLWDETSSP
ncbi:hypothetical protein V8C34DRAFT_298822 [Trichoderma compactum]